MPELTGGCACGAIRYRVTQAPLIVHACHCRDCQRLTGSAFVINLWIERDFVELDHSLPKFHRLSAGSGQAHDVYYCERCGTRLWSRFAAVPGDTMLLRAGTLDDPAAVTPDVHIYTRSKLSWVRLPEGARAFEAMYKLAEVWPDEMRARFRRNIEAHPKP